jgi:secondary thiamine-phosphate synthase enzyme
MRPIDVTDGAGPDRLSSDNTMYYQKTMTIKTQGRGTYDITDQIEAMIRESGFRIGLCHVFIHHTSASLMLCENADASVRSDLEAFMARLAPDGDALFEHTAEGEDDMPAHVRTVLTQTGLQIPITGGHSGLGTWQGIYLWEHRQRGHQRRITITLQGEK